MTVVVMEPRAAREARIYGPDALRSVQAPPQYRDT
jgi:hypothetical protein